MKDFSETKNRPQTVDCGNIRKKVKTDQKSVSESKKNQRITEAVKGIKVPYRKVIHSCGKKIS